MREKQGREAEGEPERERDRKLFVVGEVQEESQTTKKKEIKQ